MSRGRALTLLLAVLATTIVMVSYTDSPYFIAAGVLAVLITGVCIVAIAAGGDRCSIWVRERPSGDVAARASERAVRAALAARRAGDAARGAPQ